MLQDYNIERQTEKPSKLVAFIEFILVLFIIQGVLLLFSQETPEDALQFRILANSNTSGDQHVKQQVQQEISPILDRAINESANEQQIKEALQLAEPAILRAAEKQSEGQAVTLTHGAALIPAKRIGFAIQPQNVYDAYVLKIGEGKGDNWWCSLFPNVCFPEETAEETEEEPVKFFVWEWIKSIFA